MQEKGEGMYMYMCRVVAHKCPVPQVLSVVFINKVEEIPSKCIIVSFSLEQSTHQHLIKNRHTLVLSPWFRVHHHWQDTVQPQPLSQSA